MSEWADTPVDRTVLRHAGEVRTVEDVPLPDRNYLGYRDGTIAAEYETDAALVESDNNFNDPYFKAAWNAECDLRADDQNPSTHPLGCTCFLCIPGA